MIFYPAIDLKDGHCVRLVQGDMDRATGFGDAPAAQGRPLARAGCRLLPAVAPNAAREGAR